MRAALLSITSAELDNFPDGINAGPVIRYSVGAVHGILRCKRSNLTLNGDALCIRHGKQRLGKVFGRLTPRDCATLRELGITEAQPKPEAKPKKAFRRRTVNAHGFARRDERLPEFEDQLVERLPDEEREAMPEPVEAPEKPEVTPEPAEAPTPAPSDPEPISVDSGTLEVARWCRLHSLPAFVVGRWVWITFPEAPSAEVRVALKQSGFRWVQKRASWAHACGIPSTQAKSYAPWERYGSTKVEEVA